MASYATAAACNLGISSNFKLVNSHSSFKTLSLPGIYNPLLRLRGTSILPEPQNVIGSCHLACKPSVLRCSLSSGNQEVIELERAKSSKEPSGPDSTKVEALLTAICDTTSIAEFKLDLPGFCLHVKRDLVDRSIPPPVQSFPSAQTLSQIPKSNSSSIVVSKPKTSGNGIQTIVETAIDEGLAILQSPKVGLFRRSRTIKGKRAPPSCKEKQAVKEGQVLCYIEQLGGEIPVESDVSGEVIKILREDGEPVGYGDALIAVLPSFPGIKKLQ